MRPTRRLQPRVLSRVRREGVGDWLVGPKVQHVRGTEAALGQLGATLHFLVPGARAGAACPLRPEAVLSITAPASSFPEDSGSRAGTRVLGSHGGLALPSSGGELTPQSTSVESPERRHLGAASLTVPGCPPCVRWWWEGWLLSRPSCPYASQGTHPVPPAAGKVDGGHRLSGGLARPLRHPSRPAGQRCDSLRSNGQGVARGPDLQDRKWPAAFPPCRPPGATPGKFLGVTMSRKKATGGSKDGLLWKSSVGGDLDGPSPSLSQNAR